MVEWEFSLKAATKHPGDRIKSKSAKDERRYSRALGTDA